MITPQPPPPVQRPSYAERQFLHTQTAAITVPLQQTLVITIMIAFAILVLSWLFDWMDGWKFAVAALAIVPIVTWLFLQRRWLLLTAETIFEQDFSGDGVIGPVPTRERKTVRVQVDHVRENGHVGESQIIELPADDEQLQALANGFQFRRPFSEREWTGAGKPFSTNEFRELRSVMIKRGLLTLKNEKDARQGYVLTDAGQALMDQYLTSPTPTVEIG